MPRAEPELPVVDWMPRSAAGFQRTEHSTIVDTPRVDAAFMIWQDELKKNKPHR
jgi:hypothetical protein